MAGLAEHRADRASTIWAVTSLASWEFHYFWPIWVIGPWGAVLLAQTLTGGGGDRTGTAGTLTPATPSRDAANAPATGGSGELRRAGWARGELNPHVLSDTRT